MTQDVQLLDQQVRALRLEIEEMRRENGRLRAELQAAKVNQGLESQLNSLSSSIDALRREFKSADATMQREIYNELTRQISAMASETQSAINAIAEAVGTHPSASSTVHFSEDYPSSGITYTVRSGDTLSKIARTHGSTVKHIQNANQIADPSRDLQVGQTIFIPIAE